jgi:hypothetical protein
VLPDLIQLEKLGYYHSHPQWQGDLGFAKPSDEDVEAMDEGEVELIVSINDARKKVSWSESNNRLYGTLGRYLINLAGFYLRKSDGKLMQYRIVCPYAVGFDAAFTT